MSPVSPLFHTVVTVRLNRLWWPSGLSCQQYSHKLAAQDPGLNPTRGKCLRMRRSLKQQKLPYGSLLCDLINT